MALPNFERLLRESPTPPYELRVAEENLNLFVDVLAATGMRLKHLFANHVEAVQARRSKFQELRTALLTRHSADATQLTGGNIGRMFEEMKTNVLGTSNPFVAELLNDVQKSARTKLDSIVYDFSRVWGVETSKPSNTAREALFRTCCLYPNDISALPGTTTTVKLKLGYSDRWQSIGKTLSEIPLLQRLELVDCNSGDELCRIVVDCRSLRQLRMENCGVTDEGVKSLLKAQQLSELSLNDNAAITASGIKALLALPSKYKLLELRLPTLNQLIISNLDVGDRGAEIVASNLLELTCLDIGNNGITISGALDIAGSLKKLSYLSVDDNPIGDVGIECICRLTSLKHFYLRATGIGERAVQAISSRMRQLISLNVAANDIGDEGTILLANSLPNLNWLSICANGVTEKGAKAIAHKLKCLKVLCIGGNSLGDDGAIVLAQGLHELKELYIGHNDLTDRGASEILNGLRSLTKLSIGTTRPYQTIITSAKNSRFLRSALHLN